MQKEEAIDLIRSSTLAGYGETLVEYLSPSVRIIVSDETANEGELQSTSYFGGQPFLPNDATWPDWDKRNYLESEIASLQKRLDAYTERTKDQPEKIPGIRERRIAGYRSNIAKKREELALGQTPLAFLGQISLREINAIVPIPGWPTDGILAFFYDADQIWGYDPLHRGHCSVAFYPESTSLCRVEFPQGLPDTARNRKHSLRFTSEWTLPSFLELDNGELALWKTDEYRNLVDRLNTGSIGETVHRVGGYPQEVQGDMRLECQLALQIGNF